MPNHPWSDSVISSLCGKVLRAAVSSGTSPLRWGDASPGTPESWLGIVAACAGCCATKRDLAGFSHTAFAPQLHVSDAPWLQPVAVHKPLI